MFLKLGCPTQEPMILYLIVETLWEVGEEEKFKEADFIYKGEQQ